MTRNTMQITVAACAVAIATAVGCAKHEPAPPREPVSVQREQVVSASATVTKIDQKTRMVTLRADDGRDITFKAGEEIRNLPQVHVGDHVVARYYESIAAEVRQPTEEERANPKAVVEGAGRAPIGEKPAAAGARAIRIVATISDIDRPSEHVTLTGPEGNAVTVKVRDPRNLDKVRVGDPVVITYTEAVAVSVEPAPKIEPTPKPHTKKKKK